MRILFAVLLVTAIAAFGAYAIKTYKEARYWHNGPMVINVTGEGETIARPDIGNFTFGVRAEGENASQAQDASAEKTNAILAFLKENGVADEDIKTQNYSLNPRYRYEERVCISNRFCPPGEQVIDGYEVYQNVEVKVRDLEKSGDLISGVGEQGATNISGLSFTIDDTDILHEQARSAAIADAQAKAKALAKDLDVRIVKMTGFYEEEGGYYPTPYGYGGMYETKSFALEADDGMRAPELPTGESTVSARVNITYEVK